MILSIGMIVKNESNYLKMCLEALEPIFHKIESELIIVDTGSTDNTVEIAKKFTDKIYFHKWQDDFAEARNATLDKAKGQWFFYIDADEILENVDAIIDFFTTEKHKKFKVCAIRIKNIMDENSDLIVPEFYSPRIVKLDNNLRFTGRIHEQLPKREPAFLSEAFLTHYGYLITDKKLMEYKFLRNSELLKKAIEEDPDNYNMLYHLASTYQMHKCYRKATQPIETAYKIVKKLGIYPMYIYNLLAKNYMQQSRFLEAEKICKEGIENNKKDTTAYIDTYFYLAVVQDSQGKYQEAIESYNKYLNLLGLKNENKLTIDFLTTVYTTNSLHYAQLQLSYLYDKTGNLDEAVVRAKYVLDAKEMDKRDEKELALKQLISLWVKYEQYNEIIYFYEELLYKAPQDDIVKENLYTFFLEEEIKKSITAKKEIANKLANLQQNTDYILLNKVRVLFINNKQLEDTYIKSIQDIDFKGNYNFYGELIYFLMKQSIDVSGILSGLNEKSINFYMEYIAENFKDFTKVIGAYFQKYEDKNEINYLLFSKVLKRVFLILEKNLDNFYISLFKKYVKEGVLYIEHIYRKEILDEENINVVKNQEEIFFLYMRKAFLHKNENDLKNYIRYLNKSLKAYGYMKNGIEILKEEIENELDAIEDQRKSENGEFEEYQKIVKSNINLLIKAKKIGEAKALVDEYLRIVPNDLEMLTLKSEIQLYLM